MFQMKRAAILLTSVVSLGRWNHSRVLKNTIRGFMQLKTKSKLYCVKTKEVGLSLQISGLLSSSFITFIIYKFTSLYSHLNCTLVRAPKFSWGPFGLQLVKPRYVCTNWSSEYLQQSRIQWQDTLWVLVATCLQGQASLPLPPPAGSIFRVVGQL